MAYFNGKCHECNIVTRGHIHVIAENWTRALKYTNELDSDIECALSDCVISCAIAIRESLQVVLTADSNDLSLLLN